MAFHVPWSPDEAAGGLVVVAQSVGDDGGGQFEGCCRMTAPRAAAAGIPPRSGGFSGEPSDAGAEEPEAGRPAALVCGVLCTRKPPAPHAETTSQRQPLFHGPSAANCGRMRTRDALRCGVGGCRTPRRAGSRSPDRLSALLNEVGVPGRRCPRCCHPPATRRTNRPRRRGRPRLPRQDHQPPPQRDRWNREPIRRRRPPPVTIRLGCPSTHRRLKLRSPPGPAEGSRSRRCPWPGL